MARGLVKGIPQIITIVSISQDGKLNLKKDIMDHLGVKKAERLFLDTQNEVLLSAAEGTGEEISILAGGKIRLPEEALNKLEIAGGSLVGFIQRENAVAVKKVEIVEEEGDRAGTLDLETAYKITRKSITNPMIEVLLPKLEDKYKDFRLKHDVVSFLRGRRTLEAWQARGILGISETSDEELRRELIGERLEKQTADGSWEDNAVLTARNLRELAVLGMTGDDGEIQRAVTWLLERPQSPYNPGMWFLTDELVEEQQQVIRRRKTQTSGTRDRFIKRPASQVRMVKVGDDLIRHSCGPRIVWPNALVLAALLALGYEENERVQVCMRTLMLGRWCEGVYNYGLSIGGRIKRIEPFSMEEIEEFERDCIAQYRYGGLTRLNELSEKDLAHKVGTKMPRVGYVHKEGVDEYLLKIDNHSLPPCEIITVKALSRVRQQNLKRLTEAHIWRFTGCQYAVDGRYTSHHERYFQQLGYLSLFGLYDTPVARAVILRSVPWILENQNEDGSWGAGSERESATLAVIRALRRVGLLRGYMIV